jgi:hypothetical protein
MPTLGMNSTLQAFKHHYDVVLTPPLRGPICAAALVKTPVEGTKPAVLWAKYA